MFRDECTLKHHTGEVVDYGHIGGFLLNLLMAHTGQLNIRFCRLTGPEWVKSAIETELLWSPA